MEPTLLHLPSLLLHPDILTTPRHTGTGKWGWRTSPANLGPTQEPNRGTHGGVPMPADKNRGSNGVCTDIKQPNSRDTPHEVQAQESREDHVLNKTTNARVTSEDDQVHVSEASQV